MAGLFNTGKRVEAPAPVRLTVAPVAQTAALRPVQKEAGSNARALAEALGSLNGSLMRYAEIKQGIEEDPNSRANKEWIARAQQMGMDELQALATSGEADGIRVREDALNALLGEKAVSDARAEITEHFNTGFDYQSGDATVDVDEIIARHAEALPNDIARAAFTRGMGGFRQAWLDKVVETKVEYAKGEVSTAVIDSFRNAIDDAQAQGKSADEVAALVFERSASNRTFLGLSGQEQNETIIGIAEEAAQRGDADLADALLNGERRGAKGEVIPAIAKIAGLNSKAVRILDLARARQTELIERESYDTYSTLNRKVAEGSLTDADVKPLIANGTLTAKGAAAHVRQSDANRAQLQAREAKAQKELVYRQANERQRAEVIAAASHELESYAGVTNIHDVEVVSKTGEGTETITRQQAIDAAVTRKEQQLLDKREKMILEGSSEEEADLIVNRDRVSFYAANALDNDAWTMQFNGIAAMVPADVLAKGGAPAQQAQEVAELYLQVRATNPAYAEGIVSNPQAKEFLEAYEIERNITRLPPERALMAASLWQAKPETEKNRFRIKDDRRDEIATELLKGTLDSGWFVSADVGGANFALVRSKIEQLSRMNLPEPVIKKRTQEWLKSATVPVNGMLVGTNGRTPADFKTLAETRLKTLFEEVKEAEFLEDEPNDDLYLVPTPSGGGWTVWSKSRRVPLNYTITERDLQALRQEAEQKRAEEAAKIAAQGRARNRVYSNDDLMKYSN
ncbi:hypothetical protein LO749_20820 [Paracoccus denitrificans]|uniref:hypothetical protein n=1 Tax=Paracoccus denitrificans TaxID=266 RepID=UPI001E53915F|nr:hypothetical protein [Paracoccus denitrificans]UFS66938.1 hypothetical protein LO749_20820 [Paracoccus denitrificans]